MRKLFAEADFPILNNAVDELNIFLLENCTKFREANETIYVAEWNDVRHNLPALANIVNSGFAYNSSNYPYEGSLVRLIIINTETCFNAQLIINEYKAIILHELGHLLNFPTLTPVPNVMYCRRLNIDYNRENELNTNRSNAILNETFADAYAKNFNYQTFLLSTFIKQHIHFGENVGFLNERLNSIISDVELIGTIKPIVQL